MVPALFAQKLGMTQIYDEKKRHIAVTILRVPPQAVTHIRTLEKDGYGSIQLGATGRKKVNQPQLYEIKKRGIDLRLAHRHEIRFTSEPQVKIGDTITVETFAPGDVVKVTGTSKGKGFAGTIKRHGFHRGPETHGSKNVRKPGSIGGGYPQRVVLGRPMPGHLGAQTVTTRGLKVVAVNEKDATIAISGAIPGSNKSRVIIKKQS